MHIAESYTFSFVGVKGVKFSGNQKTIDSKKRKKRCFCVACLDSRKWKIN